MAPGGRRFPGTTGGALCSNLALREDNETEVKRQRSSGPGSPLLKAWKDCAAKIAIASGRQRVRPTGPSCRGDRARRGFGPDQEPSQAWNIRAGQRSFDRSRRPERCSSHRLPDRPRVEKSLASQPALIEQLLRPVARAGRGARRRSARRSPSSAARSARGGRAGTGPGGAATCLRRRGSSSTSAAARANSTTRWSRSGARASRLTAHARPVDLGQDVVRQVASACRCSISRSTDVGQAPRRAPGSVGGRRGARPPRGRPAGRPSQRETQATSGRPPASSACREERPPACCSSRSRRTRRASRPATPGAVGPRPATAASARRSSAGPAAGRRRTCPRPASAGIPGVAAEQLVAAVAREATVTCRRASRETRKVGICDGSANGSS